MSASSSNANGAPAVAETKQRLLISEPEIFIQDTLRIKFESKGYRVILVSSGRDTVRMAARHSPALILTEVDYEDIDGVRMCQLLTGHEKTGNIPIVVLTKLKDTPEARFLYSSYIKEFFCKPFSPREVAKVVDMVIRGQYKKK